VSRSWQDATFTVPDLSGTTFTYPMPPDRDNLAPRIGISFDPTGGTARAFVVNAPLATVAWNAPGHRLSEPNLTALLGGSASALVSVPSPSLKASFTHQALAGVDRELAADLTLAVNAV
jgi:hypothetical protein